MTTDKLLRRGLELTNTAAYAEAEEIFTAAVAEDPLSVEGWLGLARACHGQQKIDPAITALKRALAVEPDNPATHIALARVWQSVGQTMQSTRHYHRAIQLDSSQREAYRGLAEVLASAGDWQQAGAAYYECLRLDPHDVDAALGAAEAFSKTDRPDMAARTLRHAAGLNPTSAKIAVAYANALLEAGNASEALAAFEKALALSPDHLLAKKGKATALERLRRFSESLTTWRDLVRHHPSDGQILGAMGATFLRAGLDDEAEATLRQAASNSPFDHSILMNLAEALRRRQKTDEADEVRRQADDMSPVRNDTLRHQLAMLLYDPCLTPSELRLRTEAIVRPYEARRRRPSIPPERRDPQRPLRLGWLSSDLRYHVVASNLRPVVMRLDPAQYHQHFYADSPIEDPMTWQLRSCATQWRRVHNLTDAELAATIERDEIDILIVLAGRFDQNRPVIAARRAAPIQVSLHDPATSGLASMDYLISDRYLTPRRNDSAFTERVLRLPSFYIREPPEQSPAPSTLPLLRHGAITFGSLSNPLKITAETIALWARVLHRVPNARLILRYYAHYAIPEVKRRISELLSRHGIEQSRVVMAAEMLASGDHLEGYHDVDIALDPLPFSGSTTSFEALWMGVPVVTLPGQTMVSRWTASMLRALSLDAFIAQSADDYTAICARWASQAGELATLRQELRARVKASPLCDGERRARQFDRMFRAIWRKYCASEP